MKNRKAGRPQPGWLVSIDGIDRSGKSTQVSRLHRALVDRDFNVQILATRRDGNIAGLIRDIIEGQVEPVPPRALAFLFAAAGVVRQEEILVPALESGAIVLGDRYVYSGYAYNIAMGIGDRSWNDQMFSHVIPADLSIYLDVSVETALARRRAAGMPWHAEPSETGFASSDAGFESFIRLQGRARGVYRALVREGRMVLVNGEREEHAVLDEILGRILSLISSRPKS